MSEGREPPSEYQCAGKADSWWQCLAASSHPLSRRYAQKKADEMKAISLQSALDTVESLEIKLTDFAKKHQNEIQNDPVFRQRYVCGGERSAGSKHGKATNILVYVSCTDFCKCALLSV